MGFLFGGSKQETTTKQSIPPYIEDATKRTLNYAQGIANQPYPVYTDPRVAGLAENQKQAARSASRNADVGTGMVQSGFNVAKNVSTSRWSPASADKYMNPFIQQALDPTIRRINEEAQQNAIGTRAGQVLGGGVGAFGDARTAVLEGELEEARLRGVSDTLGTGYASAYDRAQAAWSEDQDRRLRAGDLMGAQGGRYQAVQGAALSDLMNTGGLQQETQQRRLDVGYQDHLEERDWKMRGLDAYVRALGGAPTPVTSTSSGNTGQSVAQQAVGLGLAATGMYNMFFS